MYVCMHACYLVVCRERRIVSYVLIRSIIVFYRDSFMVNGSIGIAYVCMYVCMCVCLLSGSML